MVKKALELKNIMEFYSGIQSYFIPSLISHAIQKVFESVSACFIEILWVNWC